MKDLIYSRESGQIQSECYKVEEDGKVFLEKHLLYTSNKDLNEIKSEINIQKAASDKCKNIPKILKAYKDPSGQNEFIVQMEYIDGQTLRDRMDKGLSKYNALVIFSQLCLILNNFPIPHKDLKPENIIISKDKNKIYLIDFGSAAQLCVYGTGTRGYQSPEQRDVRYRGDSKLSDTFTLGLILYEMINKEKLVLTEEELRNGKWDKPPILHSKFTDVSNEIFQKMVAINPKDRPRRVKDCMEIASDKDKFSNRHRFGGNNK